MSTAFLTGCGHDSGIYTPAVSKLTERAEALHTAGNLNEAIGRLNAASDLSPDSPVVHYNLGVLYSEKKDWPQAESHLSKSLTLLPNQPNALFSLAFTYESQYDDRTDKARANAKPHRPVQTSKGADALRQKALSTYDDYLKQAQPNDTHRAEAQAAVDSLRRAAPVSAS